MKKQPKFKHITETEYAAAKWMLTQKNKSQVAKTLGRSTATMTYIDRSTSYQNYRDILTDINARNQANKAARAAKPTPSPVLAEEGVARVDTADLAKLFTLIAEISDKLDQVIVPKRRFF